MRIDLRKLYGLKRIDINEKIIIPEEYYSKTSVKEINDVSAKGFIEINYDNNIFINIDVIGNFIIPCSITFEDVLVPFNTKIETEIEEKSINNEIYLDLLDILWENIILEIPFNIVKEGAQIQTLSGEGWKLIEED